MDNLYLIAAIGKNNELGKDNNLLWHIPEDLRFFKEQTLNKNIIMGTNTYYSLPKRLPNRKHIVITHQNRFLTDVLILHSIDDLLNYCQESKNEFYVIGGAKIYAQLIEYVSKMYLTQIADSKEADAYFPQFNENDFLKEVIYADEYENIQYKRLLYTRKK